MMLNFFYKETSSYSQWAIKIYVYLNLFKDSLSKNSWTNILTEQKDF